MNEDHPLNPIYENPSFTPEQLDRLQYFYDNEPVINKAFTTLYCLARKQSEQQVHNRTHTDA